jgi:hypothetical protein
MYSTVPPEKPPPWKRTMKGRPEALGVLALDVLVIAPFGRTTFTSALCPPGRGT